jgi:Ca2+-binding EF-hand superfamily protein
MILHRATAFILASLMVAAPAAAQRRDEQPYRPSAPTIMATPVALAIAAFDRDGDLQVDKAEFDEQVRRSFGIGDSDGDGVIGLIELSGWAERTLGNATAVPGPFNFDTSADDRISIDEFSAEFERRFAALDANKDLKLSRSELVQIVAAPGGSRRTRSSGSPKGEETRRPR